MIILNFFGDFLSPAVNNLSIGVNLKYILDNGTYNIINCEAPCISVNVKKNAIKKSGPSHYQDIKTPEWLRKNKFNIISLSNNHIMDFGEEGLECTKEAFKHDAIMGAGNWEEAYKPQIIECEGKTIAIYALTQYEFGTLADRFTEQKGVAWINHPEVIGRMLETRKQVDYLYVFAHAGVEILEQPLPEWRDVYKRFIDIGCDGVIGAHPHIVQGLEYYKGKPIVYSLGNFYFKSKKKKPKFWYRSLCFSIKIDEKSIEYNTTSLNFNDICIEIDNSKDAESYFKRINKILNKEEEYRNYINKECDRLLDMYYDLFLAGGLINVNKIYKIIKPLAKKIIRGKSHNIENLLNNIRCESHRWAISRALKNKYKIL